MRYIERRKRERQTRGAAPRIARAASASAPPGPAAARGGVTLRQAVQQRSQLHGQGHRHQAKHNPQHGDSSFSRYRPGQRQSDHPAAQRYSAKCRIERGGAGVGAWWVDPLLAQVCQPRGQGKDGKGCGVTLHEEWEVRYWTNESGYTSERLRQALQGRWHRQRGQGTCFASP